MWHFLFDMINGSRTGESVIKYLLSRNKILTYMLMMYVTTVIRTLMIFPLKASFNNTIVTVGVISLPLEIKMNMKNIFVNEDSSDILVLGSSISDTYTTKSTYYWLILGSNPLQIHDMVWSWIWKLKLPEIVRHFV